MCLALKTSSFCLMMVVLRAVKACLASLVLSIVSLKYVHQQSAPPLSKAACEKVLTLAKFSTYHWSLLYGGLSDARLCKPKFSTSAIVSKGLNISASPLSRLMGPVKLWWCGGRLFKYEITDQLAEFSLDPLDRFDIHYMVHALDGSDLGDDLFANTTVIHFTGLGKSWICSNTLLCLTDKEATLLCFYGVSKAHCHAVIV